MEKKKVYFAAPMFNLADCCFNSTLAEELENYFSIALPQRDGFEFSRLHDFLKEKLPEKDAENTVNHLIYYLDVGFLLPNCDFCIARLDEPSDSGVDVELMEAKEMRIPRIGYRTDVRTPYGSRGNEVRGAHFFPQYNCDVLINFSYINCSGQEIGKLAHLIYKSSKEITSKYLGKLPNKNVNLTAGVQYTGNEIFRNVDIHSEKGMEEILRRYDFMRQAFGSMIPEGTRIINC